MAAIETVALEKTYLAGFWRNLYPSVKKELARRYPKHEWR